MAKIQLAKSVYLEVLDGMKKILDLIGFKIDKRTEDFAYAKSQIMNFTYTNLLKIFNKWEKEGLIEKCKCDTNVRKGFRKCICGGSGYINKD